MLNINKSKINNYPVRHIGIFNALCNKRHKANLRTDLGFERYLNLGINERFYNEKPYRICKKCLNIIQKKEEQFNTTQ